MEQNHIDRKRKSKSTVLNDLTVNLNKFIFAKPRLALINLWAG